MHLMIFHSGYYITGISNTCIHNYLMHYMRGVSCRNDLLNLFNIVDGYCSGSVLACFGCKTHGSVLFKCLT